MYVLHTERGTREAPRWFGRLLEDWDPACYLLPEDPSHPFPHFEVRAPVRQFYLWTLSFWLSCTVFLLFEKGRSDFVALLIHHVATVCLVSFSYVASFWRFGLIVLILHDSVDVLLYSAKALNYLGCPSRLVDVLFFVFIILYFVCRLALFPILVVIPSLIPKSSLQAQTDMDLGYIMKFVPGSYALPAFLCVLQALHVFWFALIMRMLWRFIRANAVRKTGGGGDIRSGSEDESETDDLKAKAKAT
eukprot:Polyplicarium_translucidae@DN2918_c0_g1_i1.p2